MSSGKFSACAASVGEHDIITLSLALPLKVKELCKAVVGSIAEGAFTIRGPAVEAKWANADVSVLLDDGELFAPLPDWNRNFILRAVEEIAVRFLFHHELSHILYGHTRWLREALGVDEIEEGALPGHVPVAHRRFFENGADTSAVQRLMNQISRQATYVPGHISNGPVPYNEYGTKEQVHFAFAVALYILFRFLEVTKGNEDSDNAAHLKCHPPAWVRLQYCASVYCGAYNLQIGSPEEIVMRQFLGGLFAADRAWVASIGGAEIVGSLFSQQSLDFGESMMVPIEVQAEIERDLGPYVRGASFDSGRVV